MSELTLGSLFDGSGGFPFGGLLCGIQPVWASEIEPFPIRVTTKRLPSVKHYGDINQIDGGSIEPVDIITFGSPCTDMSVAGKRAGLDGKQSVLFYAAIRIIKEMRCATDGRYPRYIVWENVPGAFSSGKGGDFKAVLQEIVNIKDETVSVPMPESGKWLSAGEIVGAGFSIAWRTLDAQYFGVAQRRRRCYLVADFAGECAGEILFESEGLSGYPSQIIGPWQSAARNAGYGAGASVKDSRLVLNDQGGRYIDVSEDITATLRAEEHGHPPCVLESAGFCTEHSAQSRGIGFEDENSPTLRAGVVPGVVYSFEPGATSRVGGHVWDDSTGTLRAGMGDNQLAVVIENHPTDSRVKLDESGTVQTLTSRMGTGGGNVPLVMKPYGICADKSNAMLSANPHSGIYEADTSRTLDANGGNPSCNQGGIAVVALQGSMIGREDNNGPQGDGINEDISFTLNTIDRHAVAYAMTTGSFTEVHKDIAPAIMARDYKDPPVVASGSRYIVRRLTPTECALLQGFPADWCSGLETPNPTDKEVAWWSKMFETHRKIIGIADKPKSKKQIIKWLKNPYSDAAEYKMWGNGVALPCVCFVLAGIAWSAEK